MVVQKIESYSFIPFLTTRLLFRYIELIFIYFIRVKINEKVEEQLKERKTKGKLSFCTWF